MFSRVTENRRAHGNIRDMAEKTFTVGLVQAVFHKKELEVMLKAAQDEAQTLGLAIVEVRSVPGSMEIPLMMDRLLRRPDINGGVALGIIEKGETAHGRVMGDAVITRLIDMEIRHQKPLGVAILGPEIEIFQVAPRLEKYARNAVKAVHSLLTQR